MTRPILFSLAVCVLWTGIHPILAKSDEEQELEALNAIMSAYHREIEETVEKLYKDEVAGLTEKYLGALQRSLQSAQQEGNLESALAFSNEIKRINPGGDEAEGNPPGVTPPQLTNLREVYDLNLRMIEDQRLRRRTPIQRKFSERMDELQEELTMAGRLEDALHVKQRRESLFAAAPPSLPEPAKPSEPTDATRMAAIPNPPEADGELLEWLQSHELFWSSSNAKEVTLRFDGLMVQVFADGKQIMEKEIIVHDKNRFSFQWSAGDKHSFELSRNRRSFTRSMEAGSSHSGEVRNVSKRLE